MERWFGLLTEKQLRRGVHQSRAELETAIYRYLDVTNEDPKPFVWTKTADQILANVAHFLPANFEYRTLVLQRRIWRTTLEASYQWVAKPPSFEYRPLFCIG